jgi:hypothetical protein
MSARNICDSMFLLLGVVCSLSILEAQPTGNGATLFGITGLAGFEPLPPFPYGTIHTCLWSSEDVLVKSAHGEMGDRRFRSTCVSEARGMMAKFVSSHQRRPSSFLPMHHLTVVDTAVVEESAWSQAYRHVYTFNARGHIASDTEERLANEDDVWRQSFLYDENENVVVGLSERKLPKSNQWVNDRRVICTYDASGNMLMYLLQKWEDAQWSDFWRDLYTYDADGNQLTFVNQCWQNNQWDNEWATRSTYGPDGVVRTWAMLAWTNARWTNNWRETYAYNINGTLSAYRGEDGRNAEWVNHDSCTYTYGENGKEVERICQLWDGKDWINTRRFAFKYDEHGNMVGELGGGWWDNRWNTYSRQSCTYDANDKLLEQLDERLGASEWIPAKRSTYAYAENGDLIAGRHEKWENEKWAPEDGSFLVTDAAGNSFRFDQQYWSISVKYRVVTADVASPISDTPTGFDLRQNYPNPFNPSTTIRYDLPKDTRVALKIYDGLGREVATLVDERESAGFKAAQWNATGFASGVYFYRLEAGNFVSVKKLLLLK